MGLCRRPPCLPNPRATIKTGGYRDADIWPRTQDDMIEAMVKLEKALASYVAGLKS